MQDDPSKKFSKPVEVKNPREFEDFERADTGKAKEAFEREQQQKEDAAKEQKAKETETERQQRPPQKNYEMPGPGGAMVRNAVAVENSIRRAKALEAQKKADGLEQNAKRLQAGKEAELKRSGASKPEKGSETAPEKQAASVSNAASVVARAERLKLAEQARDLVKSKDEHQK